MVKNAVDKIPAPPPIIAIINTKGLIYVPPFYRLNNARILYIIGAFIN